MWADSGCFLIRLPRFVVWFMNDYTDKETNGLEKTLKFLIKEKLVPNPCLEKNM